jgi:hypothetical protein
MSTAQEPLFLTVDDVLDSEVSEAHEHVFPMQPAQLRQKLAAKQNRGRSRHRSSRVTALTRTVQQLALLDIRRRHPHAAPRELALRLASRWLEPDLMKRVFDWDVQAAGF